MKVLIIHPSFSEYGGAEIILVRLCNYMTKHNIYNEILTTGIDARVRKDLVDTKINIPISMFQGKPVNVAFQEWIRDNEERFDILNAHNHPTEMFLHNSTKPSVWYCNEPPEHILRGNNPSNEELNLVNNSISEVVVADDFNQNRFNRIYGRLPKIIPYGIDCNFYSKGIENAKETLDLDNHFVIIHPGWFNRFKNQLETVSILTNIKHLNPKVIFTGYFGGPYQQQVEEAIDRNNLRNYVMIPKFYSRDLMRQYYNAGDVILFPCGPQGGFLSVFEAIVAGRNVIISPNMGISNIVKKNNLAIVTDNYLKSILDVYEGKYTPNKEKAIEWVKKNITWKLYCSRMVKLFESQINKLL